MKRARLKEIAIEIANDAEMKSYEYWASQLFPISYTDTRDGETLAIEISILEKESDYIQIGVSVGSSGFSTYFPASYSTIIRKV